MSNNKDEYIEQHIKQRGISRIPKTEAEKKHTESMDADRYKKALDKCNQRINSNPRDEQAYLERGDVYIYLSNPKEALRNYKRAIELNQRFIKAYYGMATAYALLGSNNNAIAAIAKALELMDS